MLQTTMVEWSILRDLRRIVDWVLWGNAADDGGTCRRADEHNQLRYR